MSQLSLRKFKKTLKRLALLVGAAPLAANAGLDFSSFTCTEGELLSTLPDNNNRVMVQLYHNDYLISHDHASGVTRNYDLTNPRNPKQVGGDQNIGNAGHHHYMGVGNIIGFNWAGMNQTRLDDVPDFSRDSIVDGTDEAFMVGDASNGHHSEIITFYPIGFGNVPSAYQFDNKPVLTIHDVSKPGNPKIGEINVLDDLGFQGRVNMVGNLLFVRGDNLTGFGVGVYDIADPANPKLLDKIRERSFAFGGQWDLGRAYDTMPMYKHYIVNAMNGDTGFQRSVDVIDYSDPTNLVHVSSKDYSGPSMRYPNFKDDYMYVGEAKVDMNTFEEVASFPGAYGEFLLPIGNILVGSGQYRTGTSKVFCDQSQPDTRPPEVGFSWPQPGATGLHVNSRIGVLIHETLDINTVNEANFQIRKMDGNIVPAHVSWWSNGTINVTPKEPLKADTTYEFYMREDGVKDVAGNGLAEVYSFYFSTGNALSGGNQAPVINGIELSSNVVNVNNTVGLEVEASDPQGNPLTFNIEWGDGTTSTGSNDNFSHRYSAPGIYYVNVEAVDNFGNKDTKVIQMVVEAAGLTHHYKTSPVVFDKANNRVLNVNPDNNTITAINATTGAKIFEKPVGNDPRTLAIASNGEIWVANYDDGSLSVLDSNGNHLQTVTQMSPGAKPYGVLISPDQQYVYVSVEGGGNVLRYDRAARNKINTLSVGSTTRAMAMTSDGKTLLATRFISPENEAHVYKVDLTNFTLAATIKIAADTTSLDTNTGSRGVMNYLMGITIAPGTDIAWVSGKKDNTYRGITLDGNFGNFQNTVRSVIAKIDISQNAEVPNSKFDIDNAEIASAIDFSRGGDIVYITHQGNNRLSAYNVTNMQGLDQIDMGAAPQGIAVADNGDVFTHNFLSRSVSRITLFTGSGGSASSFEELSEARTVSNEKLSAQVLEGKRIFYSAGDSRMSMDGYMSCASCHTDGRHDGRTRDFTDRGEGLRNTTTLEGRAGTGHGRVHWSANFDEIHDFEHDIRFAFLGSGFMTVEDFGQTNTTLGYPKAGKSAALDAMNAYVESLARFPQSPFRKWNGDYRDNAEAGKAIFNAKGCYKCHGGEHFTDSPQGNRHDVGTLSDASGSRLGGVLGGLDTPTLRGIWDTAPYLHDGSVQSLSQVLENEVHLNAGTTDTGLLSANDKAALVDYLKQIDGVEGAAAPAANPINLSGLVHGQSINGASIPLNISTSLNDITEVQYVVDDDVVATLTNAPYGASYTPTATGLHRVYARAVYNAGRIATLSPELTVNVTALPQAAAISLNAAASDNGIRVGWSVTNVNANQYEVYRDTDADPSGRTRIAIFSDMNVASFEDTGVEPGKTYYYWLKVRDNASKFYNSDVAQASMSAPAPVLSLQASASEQGISLSWSTSNVNANQYELYRDTDSTTAGRTRIANFSNMQTVSYLDSSGEAGTTYYYWLKVRDTAGQFYNSTVASATVVAASSSQASAQPSGGVCDDSNSVAVELGSDYTIAGGECLKVVSSAGADIKLSTWLGGEVIVDVSDCKQDFVVPNGAHTSLNLTGTVYLYVDPSSTATKIRVDSWGSATEICDAASPEEPSAPSSSSAQSSSSASQGLTQIAMDTTYRLINKMSGKALDVSGFSQEDGAIVHQWDYAGNNNQHWYVIANGSGVQLTATHSWKCLDVPAGNTANGVQMQQWGCIGNTNQSFQVTSTGNGFFEIRAAASGKCLDYAQDPNVPAKIHQWDCHGGDNQQWQFVKVQ
ncbi:RICIN domain-containing protein [Marinagarivorans cellulosilyticus]|uniref:Galactose oxidase n=1 Tax=Marinagarivorans cellulosilyticus TaxID=2721545 RepID=A0AAN1WEB8_9GAMM|nr:RICIN domain-containing protein [Marinagarivorans cellulosilyticus]BCD96029.1 galactose oxidase [Marinagarivorans cellulosilyticus]